MGWGEGRWVFGSQIDLGFSLALLLTDCHLGYGVRPRGLPPLLHLPPPPSPISEVPVTSVAPPCHCSGPCCVEILAKPCCF